MYYNLNYRYMDILNYYGIIGRYIVLNLVPNYYYHIIMPKARINL